MKSNRMRSMFTRFFSMFMAVILVVLLIFSGLFYLSLRENRISARMEELKKQAREIAYLASQTQMNAINNYFNRDSTLNGYIEWKMKNVYEDFGAYIVVVNRQGRVIENLEEVYEDDPDFVLALSMQEILQALLLVISGNEIEMQTTLPGTNGGPVFIVGVPWIQDNQVQGAVFIHTSAQIIQSEYEELAWQIGLVMAIAALLAAAVVYWVTRRMTKPLTSMVEATDRMAKGDFAARAQESRISEIEELARAFNTMAGQLSELEDSRREFVANVSHELRSPMTSIQGFVEGMADGTIPPGEHQKYLDIVLDEIKRLNKLIHDLLSLSRHEQKNVKLEMRDFDINEMIRRVLIHRMNEIDQKGIHMEANLSDTPLWVYANADSIEQVLVNLIDNALKFTPQDGTLRIWCKTEEQLVRIHVMDNGQGILLEEQEHVFERFFTSNKAHTAGKGTGLGLSICQRILERHMQTIRLVPSDVGAHFEFTLQKGYGQIQGALPPGSSDED